MFVVRRPEDIEVRPHGDGKWAIWGNGTRRPLRVVKTWSEASVIAYGIARSRKVNAHMIGYDGIKADGSSSSQITKRDEVIERILARY